MQNPIKVRFNQKKIVKFLFSSHRHTDQTFHCTQLYCLNFRAQKSFLKVTILVVPVKKIYPDLNGLPIRELKTVSSWYFEIWNDFWHFFTLFLLHNNVGDFKLEIEEQKKVHLCVDMTNISPPSEKSVPLPRYYLMTLDRTNLVFWY